MKVNELIEQLSKLDGELELYIDVDGKINGLELLRVGPFFKSATLVSRVEFDINRAEQTLRSLLEYNREALEGITLERIQRAIGHKRVDMITKAFDEHNAKIKAEQEENAELIEEITESINAQPTFEDDDSNNPPEFTEEEAVQIVTSFYSGDKTHNVEKVKQAREFLGDERAKAIYKEVRNK